MSNVETEKLKALQEHWKSFNCDHSGDKELRKRIVAGGGVQYVYQCLRCGSAASNAHARAKAIELAGGQEPPPFDGQLPKKWKKASEDGAKEITGHFDNLSEFNRAEFHKWYAGYLESDEWNNKKQKVFERASFICEGCMEASAEVVHHTTYKNVGAEFLFELVALCHPCHDRFHENEDEI